MKTANNTLRTLQTMDIFVDIFTDHFNESLYGFVREFNEDFLLLEHYNEDGIYNGIVIFRRQDITRIRWGNNQITSAFNLITRKEHIEELKDINIDSIENIIRSVDMAFECISLQIQDLNSEWAIIGKIHEMDSETVVINEFGTMSTLDRAMLMLSIRDITRVEAGGIYENNLLKTHNRNKN